MDTLLVLLYPLAIARTWLIVPALALHAWRIIGSAVDAGRVPLVGLHDTLGFLAFCLGAVFLAFGRKRERSLFAFLSIALILLFLAGSAASPPMRGPLTPVLKTLWFELHVMLSFVSYALFGIGALLGVVYLVRDDEAAEADQYRSLLLGYVLFSLAMVFGGIWAYYAWGSYWIWTPKELWTTIVWFWYSLYLHARLVRGWTGRSTAWSGIIGFLIVLFTYVGVGLLMKSSHEF